VLAVIVVVVVASVVVLSAAAAATASTGFRGAAVGPGATTGAGDAAVGPSVGVLVETLIWRRETPDRIASERSSVVLIVIKSSSSSRQKIWINAGSDIANVAPIVVAASAISVGSLTFRISSSRTTLTA